jgi:hypothetical protein
VRILFLSVKLLTIVDLAISYGRWGWNGARQKRPLSSIVLERGIKEMLLEDAKDFLRLDFSNLQCDTFLTPSKIRGLVC